MISVPLYDNQGQKLKSIDVDEGTLGTRVKKALLREAVQMYENNSHVCTKGTLTRGMVSGSTRKMYKQKHTGNARMGNRAVGHRRGGGVTFAPMSRELAYHMPHKARVGAARTALLARLADNEVTLINEFPLAAPKTKTVAALLKAIGVQGKCLLVVEGDSANLYRSARNLPTVVVRAAADLNAFDLLQPDRLVFTQAAFNRALEALRS